MPWRCALSSASATCVAIESACGDGEWAFRESLGERLALHILQDEEVDAVLTPDIVERADMRMVQRGEHFRFPLKPRQSVGIRGKRSRQDLDGDLTFQPGVRRPIDLAHPAFADQCLQPIDADLPPDQTRAVHRQRRDALERRVIEEALRRRLLCQQRFHLAAERLVGRARLP